MKSWAKFTRNGILLYCPFLFIENLNSWLPFIFLWMWKDLRELLLLLAMFPLQQKTSKKNKKVTTLWKKVSWPTIHQITLSSLRLNLWENLWPSSQKWNFNSTFTKTKDYWQHALVTCGKWVLKAGRLLVTVRVLNVQRPE